MATLPPQIHTYHCLCTSLLLASTHTLSSLPRRSTTTGELDQAIILPLPSAPPSTSLSRSSSPEGDNDEPHEEEAQDTALERDLVKDLPAEGYTLLLSMTQDRKPTIVRREDGFERRLIWKCGRCRLVVGYELESGSMSEAMDVDGEDGKANAGEYKGKVMYLLPAGIMTTERMMKENEMGQGVKRIGESDVDIVAGAVAVFE